jgi:hypothetical protein
MGLAKHGCQLGAAYVVLYFGILGLSPAAFDLYMKQFRNMEGPEDLSVEPQITNAREVFGVHDYDEVVNISSGMDEVIIFRNFSDCRHKFETSLLPRRKDQYDTYRLITPTNHTGNVYVTGYTKGGTISKTLGETIADESPTYYASFLRLFDKHDYAELPGAGRDKSDATSLQRERSARARCGNSIHASRPFREMIARPKISRNERKTAERGAFEVGNFAPLSCPGWARTTRTSSSSTRASCPTSPTTPSPRRSTRRPSRRPSASSATAPRPGSSGAARRSTRMATGR